MTPIAQICKALYDSGWTAAVESICDRAGVSHSQFDAVVHRLCGEGVLHRTSTHVKVLKRERVLELMRDAEVPLATGKAPAAPAAAPPAQRAKPTRLALSTAVEVKRNVPLPPTRGGRASTLAPWPFATMAPGDMFEVVVPDGVDARDVAEQLRKDASAHKRVLPGLRVAVRILPCGTKVGVWRDPPEGKKLDAKSPESNVAAIGTMREVASGIRARTPKSAGKRA
jgi:hypothetical protein